MSCVGTTEELTDTLSKFEAQVRTKEDTLRQVRNYTVLKSRRSTHTM